MTSTTQKMLATTDPRLMNLKEPRAMLTCLWEVYALLSSEMLVSSRRKKAAKEILQKPFHFILLFKKD